MPLPSRQVALAGRPSHATYSRPGWCCCRPSHPAALHPQSRVDTQVPQAHASGRRLPAQTLDWDITRLLEEGRLVGSPDHSARRELTPSPEPVPHVCAEITWGSWVSNWAKSPKSVSHAWNIRAWGTGGPCNSPPCPIQWVLLSPRGLKGSEDSSWHQAPGPACSSESRSADTALTEPGGQDLPWAPALCWAVVMDP